MSLCAWHRKQGTARVRPVPATQLSAVAQCVARAHAGPIRDAVSLARTGSQSESSPRVAIAAQAARLLSAALALTAPVVPLRVDAEGVSRTGSTSWSS